MASLTKTQVLIMSATAGIAVANVYYSQPILQAIATQFHTTAEKAGTISVLSQIGYGIGLFFLTPSWSTSFMGVMAIIAIINVVTTKKIAK